MHREKNTQKYKCTHLHIHVHKQAHTYMHTLIYSHIEVGKWERPPGKRRDLQEQDRRKENNEVNMIKIHHLQPWNCQKNVLKLKVAMVSQSYKCASLAAIELCKRHTVCFVNYLSMNILLLFLKSEGLWFTQLLESWKEKIEQEPLECPSQACPVMVVQAIWGTLNLCF